MAKLAAGAPAPDFELVDLDGQRVALSDYRGRPVLINIWSAECPWAERADRALAGRLGQVALLTIAPNENEPSGLLRQAAAERGLAPVLPDPGQRVARLYGAQTTPHYFLVDPGGRLAYQGALDDVTFRRRVPTRSYVLEAIAALESGRPVEVQETPGYGCAIVWDFEAGP
jgi:peroxiredoxin